MEIKNLTKPLNIDEIDFRIQSINKGGYATILAYKDARADMNRLDAVCGSLNWKREHTRDNKNCIVSIWDEEKKQWISKEDTGSESFTEKEKGLASDSFKRSCFNFGIGRELYDYPVISVKLNSDEFKADGDRVKQTWNLKLREWVWKSEFMAGKLINLSCKDNHGKDRFSWNIGVGEEEKKIEDWQMVKIDSLVHNSTLSEDHKIEAESEIKTMTFDRANAAIIYLQDNQKESIEQELERKLTE